jgi:hypothetical protein
LPVADVAAPAIAPEIAVKLRELGQIAHAYPNARVLVYARNTRADDRLAAEAKTLLVAAGATVLPVPTSSGPSERLATLGRPRLEVVWVMP